MFDIVVKKHFNAAHSIILSDGGREEAHVHSWLCEVRVASETLDGSNCVVDFCVVERAINSVIEEIEDKDINSVIPFKGNSASAEAIAKHFYDKISALLDSSHAGALDKVTIWEDDCHGASYSRSI